MECTGTSRCSCSCSCLSFYLSICKLEILRDFLNFWTWQHQNAAILGDFINFSTWQRQKPNNSSRLPASIFQSWQHQKPSNSARLPSRMERWMQTWRPRTNAFCNFSTPSGGCPKLWYPKTALTQRFREPFGPFRAPAESGHGIMIGFLFIYWFLNSGIQTFREPYAAAFRHCSKTYTSISADVTRILKSLAWVLGRPPSV